MSAAEFFALGFRIALTPSSIPLAAVNAAREMLIEMHRQGSDRDYFARQKDLSATESWYKTLGANRK